MSSEKKSKPDQLFLIVLYQETVKTSCQSLDTGGKRDTNALFLVQPPVFGPPFKLVSGDAFSAPSAVLPKVQEVDNSELNVV